MLQAMVTQIDRCLVGSSSLQDLETWLVAHLQAILDSGDERATGIANRIDADLIEFGEGLIDEAAFRSRLDGYRRESEHVTVQVGPGPIEADFRHTRTGASDLILTASMNASQANVILQAEHVWV